jgi:AraC-like DNA-binding protein
MHCHAELEFNLVTRGAAVYLLGSRRHEIRRGDLLWLFPAQEHVLIEQTADFEMWIGVCKPQAVRHIATDEGARVLQQAAPAGECCRRLPAAALAWLDALLAEVAGAHDQLGGFNAGLRYALLSAWRHFRQAADVSAPDVHPAVERAARLIREGSAALGLTELARHSGLSAGRLGRLFKQQTGMALPEFRNRQRIENFLCFYGTGQRRTMLEAALAAGFGSYPQFHRVFKRAIGCSPGSYRCHRNHIPLICSNRHASPALP